MGDVGDVARVIRERHAFVLTSHARPDGDAIGSPLALAFALDRLGKSVTLVSRDAVPAPYRSFPGTDRIQIVDHVDGPAEAAAAAIVLECSDLSRPDIAGLDRYFVINIDHHLGNSAYGAINWFDESAAACGEMVADLIDALGVTWTPEIAAHVFLAIATDTGGFRHGHMTARTFEACRRVAATGVEVAELSRRIFDSFGVGRVKLMGSLLSAMALYHGNRLAVLAFDDALLLSCGATADDIEGLVNLPLGAREVVAVALFKRQSPVVCRVSLRSKGGVNVRAVADRWQGGGHKNASGFTIQGAYEPAKAAVISALTTAIDRATAPPGRPALGTTPNR